MSCKIYRAGSAEASVAYHRFWGGEVEAQSTSPAAPFAGAYRRPTHEPEVQEPKDLGAEFESRLAETGRIARADGEKDGYQRGLREAEPAITAFGALAQKLSNLPKQVRADAEASTVALALGIAKRILHRQLSVDPEALLGLVKSVFQTVDSRERVRLRVSPSDANTIFSARERLNLPPSLEVSADPTLPPGSAIFSTSRGEIDASLDTQLGEIERGFADILGRRGAR